MKDIERTVKYGFSRRRSRSGSSAGLTLDAPRVIRLKGSLAHRIAHSKDRYLILMILPGLLMLLVFNYFPLFGLSLAFKRLDLSQGAFAGEWVGLYYFKRVFSDIYFARLVRNTFLIGFYSLVFIFPAPVALALLLNEIRSALLKRLIQTVSYLPYFVSTVVVAGLVRNIVGTDGIVNLILTSLGREEVVFLSDPRWFRGIYIISGMWQTAGFNAILYLAAISNVNPELYEAAMMDGAGRLKQMWHVTLPSIAPTIVILFILAVGNILYTDYTKIILLYNPAIYETSDVFDTYVFRVGLQGANYSYGTAIGLLYSFVSIVLVTSTNYISRRIGGTSLW